VDVSVDLTSPESFTVELRDVHYSYYGKIAALCGISLGVREGEIFAIVGSNGCGKSTLLHVMNGLVYPSSGEVLFRGSAVSEESLRNRQFLRRFRAQMGYVFQDSDAQLFCPTVLDELMFGPLQVGLDRSEVLERSRQVLDMMEIDDLAERPSYMLSSGEKKRVAIASVLTMNPDVLLLDEPTNGLDPRSQTYLVELMLALNEAGKTLVIATHDLSLVGELRCRVGVLSEEHTVEHIGEAHAILDDTELLLRVNLIHEHRHAHGSTTHRHVHSHYRTHDHEDTTEG